MWTRLIYLTIIFTYINRSPLHPQFLMTVKQAEIQECVEEVPTFRYEPVPYGPLIRLVEVCRSNQ